MTSHDDSAGVVFSPLSQEFTQDGQTVEVTIRRPAGSSDGWTLEVIGEDEDGVVWEEPFATDGEALEEFQAFVAERGLREVINPPDDGSTDDT